MKFNGARLKALSRWVVFRQTQVSMASSWQSLYLTLIIVALIVLPYFYQSPFFDTTSNNAIISTQATYNPNLFYLIQTREAFEGRLKTMQGLEYMVSHDPSENGRVVDNSGVWVVRKQIRRKRQGTDDEITPISSYFVVGENIYMAPSVGNVLGSRLVCGMDHLYLMIKLIVKYSSRRSNHSRRSSPLPPNYRTLHLPQAIPIFYQLQRAFSLQATRRYRQVKTALQCWEPRKLVRAPRYRLPPKRRRITIFTVSSCLRNRTPFLPGMVTNTWTKTHWWVNLAALSCRSPAKTCLQVLNHERELLQRRKSLHCPKAKPSLCHRLLKRAPKEPRKAPSLLERKKRSRDAKAKLLVLRQRRNKQGRYSQIHKDPNVSVREYTTP